MGVNRFIFGGVTKFDITGDTVTPETLAKGYTAHDKTGSQITGTMESGGGGDYAFFVTTLNYSTKLTSTQRTLVTQQELVNAGIISSTSRRIDQEWNNYRVVLNADHGSITHSTRQILRCMVQSMAISYGSSSYYYKQLLYHANSTTSMSTAHSNALATTNTTGYLYISTSGIQLTPSSSYGLGVGPYTLTVICWGKK